MVLGSAANEAATLRFPPSLVASRRSSALLSLGVLLFHMATGEPLWKTNQDDDE